MKKPALVIMAAGMGSRYGGLKQIDPVGSHGELIIDYSIYDARRAGFESIVFIIKKEIERDFRQVIGARIESQFDVSYAFQELDQLPAGYRVPEGRVKPWGTTHALLAAKKAIHGPFAVINADDYYGPSAYQTLYDWLVVPQADDGKHHFCMVGYLIENTLSASGGVTRSVCGEKEGYLASVAERKMVEKAPGGARWSPDEGKTWNTLPDGTLVSINIWGLTEGFLREAEADFGAFLDANLPKKPLKCEYLLPEKINDMLQAGRADVRVLESDDLWYGVTYKEDKAIVQRAMAQKQAEGLYPVPLWKK